MKAVERRRKTWRGQRECPGTGSRGRGNRLEVQPWPTCGPGRGGGHVGALEGGAGQKGKEVERNGSSAQVHPPLHVQEEEEHTTFQFSFF